MILLMKELVIPDGECNDMDSTVFDLGAFRRLERLSVGSFSLGSILTVRIRNLKSLESIVFKEESFTRKNGELHIENCVALKTLSMLGGSFHFFSTLSLKSLPSLEELYISAGCFTEVEHFTLSSLPHLRSVSFGASSFIRKAGELRVENCQSLTELTVRNKAFGAFTRLHLARLPALQRLTIGADCFADVRDLALAQLASLRSVVVGTNSFAHAAGAFSLVASSVQELLIGDGAFAAFTSLHLTALPALKSIAIGSHSFANVTRLDLSSLPVLKSITIGSHSFVNTEQFSVNGLPALKSLTIGASSFAHGSGEFRLTHCDAMTDLSVGDGVMSNFTFDLSGTLFLERVAFGADCFQRAEALDLTRRTELKNLTFGDHSFLEAKAWSRWRSCTWAASPSSLPRGSSSRARSPCGASR